MNKLNHLGISQQELATKIGLSKASVSNMLVNLGEGRVTLATIVLLAEAVDLTLPQLFIKKEEETFMPQPIIKALNRISIGCVFELPEVAPDYWEKLSDGERRKLGKDFYEEVLAGKHTGIRFKEKKPNARYEKY